VPSSAAVWAGFGVPLENSIYPISIPTGGTISFTGAITSGGGAHNDEVDVYFKMEAATFDSSGNGACDTTPYVYSSLDTISGATESTYTVNIPAQA
jgi:hypothetical protein